MSEIDISLGLTKPLTKLIDVVSKGIGILYEPTAIRRKADAEAYRIKVIRMAEKEIKKQKGLEKEKQLRERAALRIIHLETRRQENLEKVIEIAKNYLPEEVTSIPVNEDWIIRFFNTSADISNERMQLLWGKVLAGEVAYPGKFSFRTIDILKNLSSGEAEKFQSARYLALDSGHIIKIGWSSALEKFGLTYDDILSLRSAGLLHSGDNLGMSVVNGKELEIFKYNGKRLTFERPSSPAGIEIQSLGLTNAGTELMSLIEPIPNLAYLREVAASLKSNHHHIIMRIGESTTPLEAFKEVELD